SLVLDPVQLVKAETRPAERPVELLFQTLVASIAQAAELSVARSVALAVLRQAVARFPLQLKGCPGALAGGRRHEPGQVPHYLVQRLAAGEQLERPVAQVVVPGRAVERDVTCLTKGTNRRR